MEHASRLFLGRTLQALGALAIALACLPVAAENTVKMDTSLGELTIELDADKAPQTVANFLAYVNDGFFDGLIFHRVIPGFVIQGGGFEPGMQRRQTRAPIQNEADNGLLNLKYTLSMARTGNPHSATSQFFVNLADNSFLDKATSQDGWGYAVFGRVVAGQEVIDQIAEVATHSVNPYSDVPVEDVVIRRAWTE